MIIYIWLYIWLYMIIYIWLYIYDYIYDYIDVWLYIHNYIYIDYKYTINPCETNWASVSVFFAVEVHSVVFQKGPLSLAVAAAHVVWCHRFKEAGKIKWHLMDYPVINLPFGDDAPAYGDFGNLIIGFPTLIVYPIPKPNYITWLLPIS